MSHHASTLLEHSSTLLPAPCSLPLAPCPSPHGPPSMAPRKAGNAAWGMLPPWTRTQPSSPTPLRTHSRPSPFQTSLIPHPTFHLPPPSSLIPQHQPSSLIPHPSSIMPLASRLTPSPQSTRHSSQIAIPSPRHRRLDRTLSHPIPSHLIPSHHIPSHSHPLSFPSNPIPFRSLIASFWRLASRSRHPAEAAGSRQPAAGSRQSLSRSECTSPDGRLYPTGGRPRGKIQTQM
jgi:hypothetical protein